MKKDFIGFGFNPSETENHFYVVNPGGRKDIEIYERFHWEREGEQQINEQKDVLKLKIAYSRWSKVVKNITAEFNSRLKAEKKLVGKFVVGGTPVEKLMGKELMILLWGIENNEVAGIPVAIRNWLGLTPEERWWLYTMTNASTGDINSNKRGWRMALKYILCDNPTNEANQLLMNYLGEEKNE